VEAAGEDHASPDEAAYECHASPAEVVGGGGVRGIAFATLASGGGVGGFRAAAAGGAGSVPRARWAGSAPIGSGASREGTTAPADPRMREPRTGGEGERGRDLSRNARRVSGGPPRSGPSQAAGGGCDG